MSNTSFPILTTKRIVISKDSEYIPEESTVRYIAVVDGEGGIASTRRETTTTPASNREFTKVKVEFLLKSRENTSISRWISSIDEKIAQYLKVYFIALDDSSARLAGSLSDPSFRYRSFEAEKFLAESENRELRYKLVSKPLSQVLEGNYYTTTPATDLSGDYYHDIYSEMEIDISNLDLEKATKVHLIGFLHLDVESYAIDTGRTIDPFHSRPFEKRGGFLVYDLLLERKSVELEVPYYRQAMYTERGTQVESFEGEEVNRTDLVPYYGPAHYHAAENPGPNGYVGWMAGLQDGPMGAKLEAVRIRNYKVVSSIFDTEDADVFGMGVPATNQGASSGTDLESYLRQVLDEEEILDQVKRMREILASSVYAESQLGNNFMKHSGESMDYINAVSSLDPETGDITNQKSHHAVICGINYFQMVAKVSNYGELIVFQYGRGNHDMLKRMLGKCRILDIEVTRQRVTNNAYSFNDVDSLDYKVYDLDEPAKRLVNTQDDPVIRVLQPGETGFSNKLVPSSTEEASIGEIELVNFDPITGLPVPGGYDRYFHIKDYDLFHNVQTGNYRYTLNINLLDGIYEMLSESATLLRASYSALVRYLNDASQPIIRNPQGVYIQGNYDYNINSFHASFKESDYSSIIGPAITRYATAVEILTAKAPSQQVLQQMEASLDPNSTNLETINHACTIFQSLISVTEDMLKAHGDTSQADDLKKQGTTYTPASGVGSKSRTLYVSAKCPDVISAISEGTVMANYSPYQTEDQEGNDVTPDVPNLGVQDFLSRLVKVDDRVRGNMLMPSSYSLHVTLPFTTEHYDVTPGLSEPMFGIRRNTNNGIGNVAAKVLSTFSAYQNGSVVQNRNSSLIINNMRSEESTTSVFMNKSMPDIVYGTFEAAGAVLSLVGSPHDRSPASTSRKNRSSKEKVKDAQDRVSEESCFELSDELKASLAEAAFGGVSRQEVTDMLEKDYEELNDIVSSAGKVYDNMLPLIGALQNTKVKLVQTAVPPNLEEQKFKGNSSTQVRGANFGIEKYDLYMQELAELNVVSPGQSKMNLSSLKLDDLVFPEEMRGKYIFVKALPLKQKDAVIGVNDAYLLRI